MDFIAIILAEMTCSPLSFAELLLALAFVILGLATNK